MPTTTTKAPRPAAPIDPIARYDIAEVCGYTRLSRASIYKLAKAQKLEFTKEGKRTFVKGVELIRYLQS